LTNVKADLSNLAALLRQQLFVYRDLWQWIDQPFQPPPMLAGAAERIPFSWTANLDSTNQPQPHNPIRDAENAPFLAIPPTPFRLIWTAVMENLA